MDIYDGYMYGLITRFDICLKMDVFPLEYGTFSQMFYLKI